MTADDSSPPATAPEGGGAGGRTDLGGAETGSTGTGTAGGPGANSNTGGERRTYASVVAGRRVTSGGAWYHDLPLPKRMTSCFLPPSLCSNVPLSLGFLTLHTRYYPPHLRLSGLG